MDKRQLRQFIREKKRAMTPEQIQEKAGPEYILNQTKELVTLF